MGKGIMKRDRTNGIQLTPFDMSDVTENNIPCSNCIFERLNGVCTHIENDDYYCVLGGFQVRKEQIICLVCRKTMAVLQSDFGSDYARCTCGTVIIFNNQGNRLSALELWKKGLLVGS